MSALASLTLEALQTNLADAIASRHRLMTGPSQASSSGGGMGSRSVTFNQRKADLDSYIFELQAAIDAKQNRPRGPFYLARG